MRYFKLLFVSVLCIFCLAGCFWKKGKVFDRELSVESDMSSAVYLQPVLVPDRTVYLKSNQSLPLAQFLEADGYRITSHPNRAHFRIEVNIVKQGQSSAEQVNAMLQAGYGGTLFKNQNEKDQSNVMNTCVTVADAQISEKLQGKWNRYKNRIICHAQKENLQCGDIESQMRECIANSIVKMF